jgi:hypothetical protein
LNSWIHFPVEMFAAEGQRTHGVQMEQRVPETSFFSGNQRACGSIFFPKALRVILLLIKKEVNFWLYNFWIFFVSRQGVFCASRFCRNIFSECSLRFAEVRDWEFSVILRSVARKDLGFVPVQNLRQILRAVRQPSG